MADLATASRSIMEYIVLGTNGRRVPFALLKPGLYLGRTGLHGSDGEFGDAASRSVGSAL